MLFRGRGLARIYNWPSCRGWAGDTFPPEWRFVCLRKYVVAYQFPRSNRIDSNRDTAAPRRLEEGDLHVDAEQQRQQQIACNVISLISGNPPGKC